MESGPRNQQTNDDFKDAKLTIHRKKKRTAPQGTLRSSIMRDLGIRQVFSGTVSSGVFTEVAVSHWSVDQYKVPAETAAPTPQELPMKRIPLYTLALTFAVAAAGAFAQAPAEPAVTRLDPALDALVSSDATLDLVTSGHGFTEGVTWVDEKKGRGFLVFSDVPANTIYQWSPETGESVYLEKSGNARQDQWRLGMEFTNGRDPADPRFEKFAMSGSNGLALDRQGRLLIATSAGRSIDRIEKNGQRTVLADRFEGKRFGGTNDLVVARDGAIYFTDTYGGMRKLDKDPAKELDAVGIYRWKSGKVTRVIDDIFAPNGLAFSPDGRYLYADGGNKRYIRRYEVQPDGSVAHETTLIDLNAEKLPGITDGMKVDTRGNIWTSGPGGIWIISPEGKPLGRIRTPELVGNLAFGDADNKTLYVAARSSIYRIRVNTPGLRGVH